MQLSKISLSVFLLLWPLDTLAQDDTKARARIRDYDEKATINCAQEVGEALGTCEIGVARSAEGHATAVVTFPNGFARQLYFRAGAFTNASATMSGSGSDTDWQVQDGNHLIRVDDQRYVIPDQLLFGE